MTTISIRQAEFQDCVAIERLLRRGLQDTLGFLPPYDQQFAYRAGIDLIGRKLVWVAQEHIDETHVRIVGVLMLDVKGWNWNPAIKYLENVHFYILPEYRAKTTVIPLQGEDPIKTKMTVATHLLDVAKQMAKTNDMALLMQMIYTPKDTARKDRFFESSGMSYTGGNFFYLPQQDQPPAESEHLEEAAAEQAA